MVVASFWDAEQIFWAHKLAISSFEKYREEDELK